MANLSRCSSGTFQGGNYLANDVLISLSINYPVKASNLLVFGSVLDEALDFLLTILRITAAPKPPPTNAPPTAPQPEPHNGLVLES
nr:MAG: hypothetical protein [Bacteriophage sp.]